MRAPKRIVTVLFLSFTSLVLLYPSLGGAEEDAPTPKKPDFWYDQWLSIAEEGLTEKYTGFRVYWKNGFNMETRKQSYTLRIGGKFLLDLGEIASDEELERTFPDLDGPAMNFRRLSVALSGTFYDWLAYKLEIDFANVKNILDVWVRFEKIPYIDFLTLGHMKEPFSLERWASLTSLSFMERALPTNAFAPNRNLGIRRHNAILDDRMSYALGVFWNVASFEEVGDLPEVFQNARGFNVCARVTGVPWYEEGGGKMLHLGLSYTHLFRDRTDIDMRVRFSSRPESRLTEERLADTGQLFNDSVDIVNPEGAIVLGPLSFQGEYFHTFVNSYQNLQFWGYYLYGSYFFTGERRRYGKRSGTFFETRPIHPFHPLRGEWGGWELLFRHSYVDLNDGRIRGGKQSNATFGLNWHLGNRMRIKFNYVHIYLKDRANPPVENGRADIFQARFQFAF
jgi:phosphate-selective porin OprO/OprP